MTDLPDEFVSATKVHMVALRRVRRLKTLERRALVYAIGGALLVAFAHGIDDETTLTLATWIVCAAGALAVTLRGLLMPRIERDERQAAVTVLAVAIHRRRELEARGFHLRVCEDGVFS